MRIRISTVPVLLLMIIGVSFASAQDATVFTGTAVIYGSGFNTRTVTRTFTLRIKGQTPSAEAERFLGILERGGQNALRDEINDNDFGRFSLGASVGNQLEAVLIDELEGKTRIRAVFERYLGFGELRGGYRSTDYPFGYVELLVDRRTGKGEGSFFPAARIRFKSGKNGAADAVEIEDFGTFPARLFGVSRRGGRL